MRRREPVRARQTGGPDALAECTEFREKIAALAGKYRHPAVAPHLRALQRQFPAIEALIGW